MDPYNIHINSDKLTSCLLVTTKEQKKKEKKRKPHKTPKINLSTTKTNVRETILNHTINNKYIYSFNI